MIGHIILVIVRNPEARSPRYVPRIPDRWRLSAAPAWSGGATWGGGETKCYENVVELAGGGSKILSRRERPHVVLDKAGTPIGLTNGGARDSRTWPAKQALNYSTAPEGASSASLRHRVRSCGLGPVDC